jgi:hypothetical protein
MKVFELASGDYLVISHAGVQTVVIRNPYPLSGGVSLPQALRTVADAIEAAGNATAPIERAGVCRPA